jgi:glucose/arabinose dehydrogenase
MQNRCVLIAIALLILLTIAKPVCADPIFVANHGGDTGNPNTIEQFTLGGVGSVFANTGSQNYPTGLAFGSDGYLYVSMDTPPHTGESIVKFTPGGVGSVFINTGLSDPTGIAFDASGNLYVANLLANTIAKVTPGGGVSVFASPDSHGVITT